MRVPHSVEDLSKGVAIGSGIFLDEHTQIEATRYPAGSDAMGLLATLLAGGRTGWNRIWTWLRALGLAPSPSPTHGAMPAPFRLGARVTDPALHAIHRGPHRYALGPAMVLAVSQGASQPRQCSKKGVFDASQNGLTLQNATQY